MSGPGISLAGAFVVVRGAAHATGTTLTIDRGMSLYPEFDGNG